MASFPDSFHQIADSDSDSVKESVDASSIFINGSNSNNTPSGFGDDVFASHPDPDSSIYGFDSNGSSVTNGVFVESNGPILPPPSEMREEGFPLREWRRQNAILLEQKEKREKETLSQIIEEANGYKVAFHDKRKVTCENNKTNNRQKAKLFLANQEKFHKEADKNYWKAIAELIPNEVPAIKKKIGKKDEEKKPSIVVIHGPKPGKSTDLARMRQVLIKLKHTTPTHLKFNPSPSTVKTTTPEAIVAA